MLRWLLLNCFALISLLSGGNTIIVKNITELNNANTKAIAGDVVILQNGEWKDVTISLNCHGTKEKPILFKAQAPGKVLVTGNSRLQIGGEYIIVNGLYFTHGYSGKEDVIEFRIDNKQLANHCRVTNTVINDFNNPKRMEENNWVSLYGKNNRLDNCSFINKKNLGVLLAVLLDDERSRENFHSIDNNYFGKRAPLASNGGEIIRVGLSQHCQFNSNTQITNNYFEECDGEAEVISIKSCSNKIEKNTFKECQGSVVLRHGDNNVVNENRFLGNGKPGTGGVRVINKGQKIVNNIFYGCRGVDFRAPLVLMNGVPNSPATRYVQVTNAEITGNSFYECAPIALCEGSDTERTLPPMQVTITGNRFYNTRDSIIYKAYDDISGIRFSENKVSNNLKQALVPGFEKMKLVRKEPFILHNNEKYLSGASWFTNESYHSRKSVPSVNCATAEDVYKQLEKKEPAIIRLTGTVYSFTNPVFISENVLFISDKHPILFNSVKMPALFIIGGKGALTLESLIIGGESIMATHFVASESTGPSDHYSLSILNSTISDVGRGKGCFDIFYACKSMVADSIIIRNSQFLNNDCNFFTMNEEKDDKGYYNAENIFIGHNRFLNQSGSLLDIYRGGTDESTLGPHLIFSHNKIQGCNHRGAVVKLTGVQQTEIFSNNFSDCNPGSILISFKDMVRANHNFEKNSLTNSGRADLDKYVVEKNNTTR